MCLELGTCIMLVLTTTTIIPSRSPAPNVVIICWGAGHCTVYTLYSVYSVQWSAACAG